CVSNGNCFALSESIDGAGKGVKSLFGAILDASCAGGLTFKKNLLPGPHVATSAWNHNPLPWLKPDEVEDSSRQCWCGKQGCIETWISTGAVLRDTKKLKGDTLSLKKLIHDSENDSDIKAFLEQYTQRLARGLALVVNIFDSEMIVLGGELAQINHLYTRLPILMAPYILARDGMVDVRQSKYGLSSKARGAARLWETS
ncbi:MAG: ROK family protein, partial [Alphaproteobacteria bacterium]|nr:ROK family protein [Alphaproteobacteria bacterium]